MSVHVVVAENVQHGSYQDYKELEWLPSSGGMPFG